MLMPPMPDACNRLNAGLAWWERWHARWRWRLCPFVQITAAVPAAARVVDIGSGRCLLANYLALTGPERMVLGIDSQSQRSAAAQATVGERKNIGSRLQDGLALPKEDFNLLEEVGDHPRWKNHSHCLIDRALNLGHRQYFRHPREWAELLSNFGFNVALEPAQRCLPLSEYIFGNASRRDSYLLAWEKRWN